MSILLMIEDSSSLEVMKLYLEDVCNRKVIGEHGCKAAMPLLDQKPEILILEYGIYTDDDCEEIIKAARKLYKPKIFIITGIYNTDYLQEKLKPDGIIPKPFELEQIDKIIA